LVDHGGFAMVNVGNDGDVSDLLHGHGSLSLKFYSSDHALT
jgi:hypothetical protein